MKIIIPFGKPGAGKGTLIGRITKMVTGWQVLSTGGALRIAVAEGTEIGIRAKSYMDAGKLVPDEIVVQCVKNALASIESEAGDVKGIILDGFPRNVSQVEAMKKLGINPTKILVLDVSDETVIKRLSARVECEKCKTPYSLLNPLMYPKVEGFCDQCGGNLVHREDDKPETVKARLKEYNDKTAPVLEKFKELGVPIIETSSDVNEDEIEGLLS